jgi:hypothetical protein
MNGRMIALVLFVGRVTGFASLGIFRIPSLGKVLLRGYCEYEFFSAFTADEDPRLEPALHAFPSLIENNYNLVREAVVSVRGPILL